MKSVGIIGAGPAGLAAAKSFLDKSSGDINVTILEAADKAGGMWRAESGEDGDKCSPEMRTNLSKFTVAFSDLSWNSEEVDISDPENDVSGTQVPLFPKAWQVGRYLRAYARKWGIHSHIKFNSRVTRVEAAGDFKSWTVTSQDSRTQQTSTHTFDHLVIANGFFSKPIVKGDNFKTGDGQIQHSSKFRDVGSLPPGKVVVIGGGISGSEAAAQAAFQVSSCKHSPGTTGTAHAETVIYHVVNRPFYCMPRYLPTNPHNPAIQDFNLAPKFLPLDLVLYDLSRRGEGPISAAIGIVPPDKAKKGHEFIRSVIGGDQRELGHTELVYRPEHLQYPAYTGISDTYSEFVRSGTIIPIQGWVEDVKPHEQDGTFSILVTPKSPWRRTAEAETASNTLSGVTGIIEATGFETDLDYLDIRVKQLLGYDPSCPRVPLLLSRGSIFVQDIPTLAFVGFYEGPYWAVMELQARLISERWMDGGGSSASIETSGLLQQTDAQNVRRAMEDRSLQVPQFWMMDYLGLVEELSRATRTGRDDTSFKGQQGPAFPARYQHKARETASNPVAKEVTDVIEAAQNAAPFVAAAVFRGMQGMWKLQRKIDSRNSASPGGTFSGSAHFHPRTPTNPRFCAEYLYIEEGTFKMDTGLSFPASRRYIYRLQETPHTITAWFADEDGKTVGALFNTWQFYPPEDDYHGWMAKGDHWCDPDTYKNTCEFRFRAASLQSFGITYEVRGPHKDYSHESWYERPKASYN